jgi:hypothetical protein
MPVVGDLAEIKKAEPFLGTIGLRAVGVEPTNPARDGGFKDRCVYLSTTPAIFLTASLALAVSVSRANITSLLYAAQ